MSSIENPDNQLLIFHFDFNFVSLRKTYIRKWLKKIAEMGYNAVLWELENKIQWETCPECVHPEAMSKTEFREMLAYAASLGLESMPLLQTIGHGEYVLMHEKYTNFREQPEYYDCYCTSNPAVRTFLRSWIQEYVDLFGNLRHFHLGGDEAYVFGTCPDCKSRVETVGRNQLYIEHLQDIAQPVFENGARPGIWGDMILHHPKEMQAIPAEFVIWDWNYWDGDHTPERVRVWSAGKSLSNTEITPEIQNRFPQILNAAGDLNAFYTSDFLQEAGYDVILCSSSRCSGDSVFAGIHETHASNIVGAARKTVKSGFLGNCITSWAIRIHHFETQVQWLNLPALTFQNPELPMAELLHLSAEKLFGKIFMKFWEAIANAGFSFPFANGRSTGIQWTGFKDSRPAPENYISDLIKDWQQRGEWSENVDRIKIAPKRIANGVRELHEIAIKASQGKEILHTWSRVGHHQFWRAIIANQILEQVDGKTQLQRQEILHLLYELRADYLQWSQTWMTPKSAEENTGLIFDAIISYFEKPD